jgi:flavodoxin
MSAVIVYYSYSGSTEKLAGVIARQSGYPMVRLEVMTPYPKDEEALFEVAASEIKRDVLPALKPIHVDWNTFETLFVGTPNWFGTFAPPVATFLDQVSCEGKTIVPFCANDGGHAGNIGEDMRDFCPKAHVLPCFEIFGWKDSQKAVSLWLASLSLGR